MRFRSQFHRFGSRVAVAALALLGLLAARELPAAVPRISEFMAENKTVLADQDGEFSDWIELFNPGPGALDLGGHHLTDERAFPAKWRIPAGVIVPAGGFKIVFASGKDRTSPTNELHTNFQLSKGGEYFALVAPDGVTVLQSFDPYPAQQEDVSFGPGRAVEAVPLVTSNSTVRVHVPAGGALGTTWTGGSEPFDDSAWLGGLWAVGFDTGVGGSSPLTNKLDSSAFTYRYEMDAAPSTQDLDGNAVLDFASVNSPPVSGGLANGTNGTTFDANFAGSIWRAQFGTNFTAEFSVQVLTTGTEGSYGTLSLTASKGSSIAPWLNIRRSGESWGTVSPAVLGSEVNTDAQHRFRLARSGNNCWIWRDDVLLNPGGLPFAPSTTIAAGTDALFLGDNSGTGNNGAWRVDYFRLHPAAVAPNTEPNVFSALIRTDVRAAMSGVNAGAYVRVPFGLPGAPGQFSKLVLRVRCDDGFVAYCNGVEVARRNAPVSPAWNSAADTNRTDTLALSAETIDVTPFLGALVSGSNILAFHALNSASNATRFVIAAELDGERTQETNVFFAAATPGGTNTGGALPPLPKVDFSLDSQVFSGALTLALSNAQPGAAIWFTTNGAAPAVGVGQLYTAPIGITNSVQVRARAFLTGWSPSATKTESFVKAGADLATFSSPLPVVVLHNFGAGPVPGVSSRGPNGDGSDVVEIAMQPHALTILDRGTNGLTTFTNTASTKSRAGLRIRGSSAFNNTKKSFAIETWTETDNEDRDVSPLGLPADSDWVLYGPSWKFPSIAADFDAALIHNTFIYELANLSGFYAPRTRFVEVFINTNGGPVALANFHGIYVLAEKPKRAGGRVDIPALSADGATGGWMINSDRMDALPPGSTLGSITPRHFATAGPDRVLQTTNDNPRGFRAIRYNLDGSTTTDVSGILPVNDDMPAIYHSFFNFESPDGWTITAAQRSSIENFMRAFDAALYGPDYTNPVTGYAPFIDVQDWVHHHILHNLPKNQDAEVLSTYFIRDSQTAKLRHGPIWDFDRAYTRNPTSGAATGNLDWGRERLFNLRLFSDVNFFQAYIDKWQSLRRGVLADTNLFAIVDRQVNEVSPGGTNNAALNREGMTDWPVRIATFKTWLTNRTAALDAQFLKMPVLNQHGGAISNGFPLGITNPNPAGTIFFTLDGSDPRAPGGAVAAAAQAWPQSVALNATTVVRARVRNSTNWSGLADALFITPQDFSGLALTELMYNPLPAGATNGDEFEFIELKNRGTNVLNLSGMSFTGIGFTFTNGSMLAPGAFVVLARNTAAFAARNPGVTPRGAYSGRLDNGGETIALNSALGTPVFSLNYGDAAPWPLAADGSGFSLVPRAPATGQAPDDGLKWRASAAIGGSPGADDPEPAFPPVVINELLTHTDPPLQDSIELHNPTAAPANVGGWFLSDDAGWPRKFVLPNPTIIPAFGHVVFTETNFNTTPGTNLSFTLSSLGETVYLCSGDGTNFTGYSHGVSFGAAANGVSFGRHLNSAVEEFWPAQISRTPGATNSGPRVGPVVLSEVFYHPPTGGVEFLEVVNISAVPQPLFDPAFPTNTWRLAGAGFAFPTNITLPPGGIAVIAATNEAAFRLLHSVPTSAPVFGPFTGNLQDSGERLSLERPDPPQTNGAVPYIVVDEVRYNDKSPWPAGADGAGDSLQRVSLTEYANEPLNWTAATPTPGMVPSANPDRDGDGMTDSWETAHGLDPDNPADAALDADGDSMTNLQEFLAGTDPNSATSALRVGIAMVNGTNLVRVTFTAAAGRGYAIQARPSLGAGAWSNLFQWNAASNAQTVEWLETAPATNRYFRLITPVPAP
jgi:hypothetical protein